MYQNRQILRIIILNNYFCKMTVVLFLIMVTGLIP
jgi:hypothetical protein